MVSKSGDTDAEGLTCIMPYRQKKSHGNNIKFNPIILISIKKLIWWKQELIRKAMNIDLWNDAFPSM